MPRSAGNSRNHDSAIKITPTPPISAEGTAPIQAASAPARNSPSVPEEPENIEFTDMTRPSMSWGVRVCTNDWRITTLMASAAPYTMSAAKESAIHVDSAKIVEAMPNMQTVLSIRRPARRSMAWRAKNTDMLSAPTAGAEQDRIVADIGKAREQRLDADRLSLRGTVLALNEADEDASGDENRRAQPVDHRRPEDIEEAAQRRAADDRGLLRRCRRSNGARQ